MKKAAQFSFDLNTKHYSVLSPIPPFVDILLSQSIIDEMEFKKIVSLIDTYQSDARLIEMVRLAGDTSAKVPYLLADGETPDTILTTLRQIAQPQVEYLAELPKKMQATIHTLLSVNRLPVGYEEFGIPALLEIDRMQGEMIKELRLLMAGRKLAEDFYQANLQALKELDQDWAKLRQGKIPYWPNILPVPQSARMHFDGQFEFGRLKYVRETCVVVDPPKAGDFKKYIPAVIHKPLAEHVAVPATGSADWLIRETGKIGRHFTRALLEIIKGHLAAEKIALDAKNYELIAREAREALDEKIMRLP